MRGKHFEDFAVGDAVTSPWRVISESELRRFLGLSGIEEPLFESRQYVERETDHDPWLVPGLLTLSVALGLFTRSGWIEGTGLAMLGAESIAFAAPVHAGDEIRAVVETVDTTPTTSDRGGVVTLAWDVQNQDRSTVATMRSSHFIRKREG